MSDTPAWYTRKQEMAFAALRILFGVIWAINTWLEANAPYVDHFVASIAKSEKGQPAAIQVYLHHVVSGINVLGAHPVAVATVVVDALLALSLLTGIALRPFAYIGVFYNLFLWSTVGGFGGPYTTGGPGSAPTDPGTAIVYALAFLTILAVPSNQYFTVGRPRPEPVGPKAVEPIRILFGLLWAFDAYWKWQPGFLQYSLSYLHQAQAGQPAWIVTYIGIAIAVFGVFGSVVFGVFAALFETVLAVSLLFKRAQNWFLPIGALYSFGVWTTAEGWGGPYSLGSTGNRGDILGTANIYILIYLFLMVAYTFRRPRAQ